MAGQIGLDGLRFGRMNVAARGEVSVKSVGINRALLCAAVATSAVPANARFLQVDPVGYKDQINLYEYVGDDPINARDPTGLYICKGETAECGALRNSLGRVQEALKSDNLTKGDRAKLQGALDFYGKEGKNNGVTVVFRDPSQVRQESGGRTDTAFTKPTSQTGVAVTISNRFPVLYDKTHMLPQYSRVNGPDQRANLLVHEADHGMRFKAGQTLQDYNRNESQWEHAARLRGLIVNKAFGSEAVCQSDNAC